FVDMVHTYRAEHHADMVAVHSTVPAVPCEREGWVHSPIRGRHPDLEEGVASFTKHSGGQRQMRLPVSGRRSGWTWNPSLVLPRPRRANCGSWSSMGFRSGWKSPAMPGVWHMVWTHRWCTRAWPGPITLGMRTWVFLILFARSLSMFPV